MKPASVTLVIPSYDGRIRGLMEELMGQTIGDWDHVVVQGVSPAARARNIGARKAGGEYVIFIDDDARFNSPEALNQVINALGCVGRNDAVSLSWRLKLPSHWLQRALWGKPLYTFGRNGTLTEMPWSESGAACFAMRLDRFIELGGFDEELVSAEDCDLAYRITKGGGRIFTLPQCWIEHDPPRTIPGAIRKVMWYERGNAQMARKNPDAAYRVNLGNPVRAIAYLVAHTAALIPLMFFRITYRHRAPQLSFRPLDALMSYVGAWAYTIEWLFPTGPRRKARSAEIS